MWRPRLLLFAVIGLVCAIILAPRFAPRPSAGRSLAPPAAPAVSAQPPVGCAAAGFEQAAQLNAASLTTLAWKPFHRDEVGWEIYAPRIAVEIGAGCPAASPGFAAALARWQAANRLPVTGQVDAATFAAMSNAWERARPFERVSAAGVCPAAPAAANLAWADPDEGYLGKPI